MGELATTFNKLIDAHNEHEYDIFWFDTFLVDTFLLQNVHKSVIDNITWSDHAPVSITVGRGWLGTRANSWRNDVLMMSQPDHKNHL